jgi:cell division protein ZipA
MTSELRWILLIIGVVFLGALTWWELRRPRQASRASASERPAPRDLTVEPPRSLRDPSLALPEMRAFDPLPTRTLPVAELPDANITVPDPPLAHAEGESEPLAAETALGGAPAAGAEGESEALAALAAEEPVATPEEPPELPRVAAVREVLPELPAAEAPQVDWPPDDQRRIVALRLVAASPERFPGRSLRQALAAEGFVLGRFAIFHKPDEAHRAVLSAASLSRPGTFDPETMDSQHYGGLSLFAVLPGPKEPPQAFDELVFTARNLNERLHGVLQDEQGTPLTPSRIAHLRERLKASAAS